MEAFDLRCVAKLATNIEIEATGPRFNALPQVGRVYVDLPICSGQICFPHVDPRIVDEFVREWIVSAGMRRLHTTRVFSLLQYC